jgi:hypothetical protein
VLRRNFAGFRAPLKKVKMAGSNKYSYYSNSALQTTTFFKINLYRLVWWSYKNGAYTQNNISVSGSENIKYFFSVGNYEEKAVLNGLDYSRTTFRNNNEYKISKKLTLNQNFSFGITNQTKAFKCFYECQAITYYSCSFSTGQYGVSFVGNDGFVTTGSSFNNVGNPVAQLDFFWWRTKVSSYKVVWN